MERPESQAPETLAGYLEAMTRIVFQSGMSRGVIQAKWPGITSAFHDFDPQRVASMSARELQRVATDERVIRSRPKIEAVVHNARELVELDKQPGGFAGFLKLLGPFEEAAPVLRKRFRY